MWQCSKCGEQIEDEFDSCERCSKDEVSEEDDQLLSTKAPSERVSFWLGAGMGAIVMFILIYYRLFEDTLGSVIAGIIAGIISGGVRRGLFAGFIAVFFGIFIVWCAQYGFSEIWVFLAVGIFYGIFGSFAGALGGFLRGQLGWLLMSAKLYMSGI